jgi:hypothetical protein
VLAVWAAPVLPVLVAAFILANRGSRSALAEGIGMLAWLSFFLMQGWEMSHLNADHAATFTYFDAV